VLGCLVHHPRVLAAVRAAGGGASLLPALRSSCKLALTGAKAPVLALLFARIHTHAVVFNARAVLRAVLVDW